MGPEQSPQNSGISDQTRGGGAGDPKRFDSRLPNRRLRENFRFVYYGETNADDCLPWL